MAWYDSYLGTGNGGRASSVSGGTDLSGEGTAFNRGGDPQGPGGYLAQLLRRMKANRGDFSKATQENIGAGSLSRGFGGGGGGARGGLVNNTPGVVQLLSLLANRNRQF